MANFFTFYESAGANKGQIIGHYHGPAEEVELNLPSDGAKYIEGKYDENFYYVDAGKAAKKLEMKIDIKGSVVTNLPNPTTVFVDGTSYVVKDGKIEFTSNVPGPHHLTLLSTKYFTKEITLP